MHCLNSLFRIVLAWREATRVKAQPVVDKDRRDDQDCIDDPGSLMAILSKGEQAGIAALQNARMQAACGKFKDCVETAERAIPDIPPAYKTPCEAIQSYALFRLGREEQAISAAKRAAKGGASSGFVHALAGDDPTQQAQLRRIYPVC